MLQSRHKTMDMQLIPCAQSLTSGTGRLWLDRLQTIPEVEWIGCKTPRLQRAVQRLEKQLSTRLPLSINCLDSAPDHPTLHCDESYQLEVDAQTACIRINANSEWGILRSFSTVAQLLTPANTTGPPSGFESCKITDTPVFSWRGLMLDPARHFLSVSTLHETLDLMFLFKLNVLHLHLTDDQGFRFFSPTFPELARVGGKGEYYTTEELKDLVRCAADRGIRIIPELDIPGHCTSWIAARPDWGAGKLTSTKGQPSARFGGHKACLDPVNQQVYKAMEILLGELADVFPDDYVHLGGDEVNPAWWNSNPDVQRFMQAEQLDGITDLQNHFMLRIVQLAKKLGKKIVGWDEILHSELSRSVLIQSWRSSRYRDIALDNGFDCIFSSAYYLDLFYPADLHYKFVPNAETQALKKHEDNVLNDPRLEHIKALGDWLANYHAEAANKLRPSTHPKGIILGGEACMWSELVCDDLLHTRIWSRMPVIAERLWSGARTATDIYPRLAQAWTCMDFNLGINIYGPVNTFVSSFDASKSDRYLLLVLLYNLEPVKGYARLLGDQADARVSGNEVSTDRPYQQDTRLNRVVDLLPPESLAARTTLQLIFELADSDQQDTRRSETKNTLKKSAEDWCAQLDTVRKLQHQNSVLAEIVACSEALAQLGVLLTRLLALVPNKTAQPGKIPLDVMEALKQLKKPACELVIPVAIGLEAMYSAPAN